MVHVVSILMTIPLINLITEQSKWIGTWDHKNIHPTSSATCHLCQFPISHDRWWNNKSALCSSAYPENYLFFSSPPWRGGPLWVPSSAQSRTLLPAVSRWWWGHRCSARSWHRLAQSEAEGDHALGLRAQHLSGWKTGIEEEGRFRTFQINGHLRELVKVSTKAIFCIIWWSERSSEFLIIRLHNHLANFWEFCVSHQD